MPSEAPYTSSSGLRKFDTPAITPEIASDGQRRRRVDRIFVQLTATDPEAFDSQLDTLRRYGLPSQSMSAGSRGADPPLPIVEAGPVEGAVKDAFDRKLRDQERIYDQALRTIELALRDMLAVQRFVCLPLSREKARQALIDEAQGEYRFTCYGCDGVFKRTRTERPRSMRCTACYQWFVANGRPDTNTEAGTGKTPKAVIDARIRRAGMGKL